MRGCRGIRAWRAKRGGTSGVFLCSAAFIKRDAVRRSWRAAERLCLGPLKASVPSVKLAAKEYLFIISASLEIIDSSLSGLKKFSVQQISAAVLKPHSKELPNTSDRRVSLSKRRIRASADFLFGSFPLNNKEGEHPANNSRRARRSKAVNVCCY